MPQRPVEGRKTLRNYEYMRDHFRSRGYEASAVLYQGLIDKWHSANKKGKTGAD